ncbi:hypothetical protein JCGZ_26103 [Jatropha curcas]|uniref:Uncharacterized protein n=1 Tax=Jatropha curcas TaxID=180498 RepID=A0A067JEN2_JATCU|nr:hypothetical protein JCGZ_26103 [Jatropha curcas]
MEVQIISKEIIKPSSSTPQNLKTYNLSLPDQLAPPVYIPIILFHSPALENGYKISDHLKKSFSETLTHFYPLAGRINDEFSIDCNDDGAPYVEACVNGDMSTVLVQEPGVHKLEKLLPCNPHDLSSQVILAAQINHFDCSGIAISIRIWHAIANASAVASFITSWATIASGANFDINGVIFDSTSLFPPQDLRGFSLHNFKRRSRKWAVFGTSDSGGNCGRHHLPAVMAGNGEEHVATMSVGNLRESIERKNKEYVRKIHAEGRYFEFLKKNSEELGKNPNLMKVFGFSSWCRFPFYEADFGWGKPIWVGTALKLY